MFAGEPCPECDHDDTAGADCICDTCLYAEPDDDSDVDSELDEDEGI
jgi:hypothetical protein